MKRTRLSEIDKEEILALWKAGKTQNQLAKDFRCSPATINKICKGIEQENISLVNTQAFINRELQQKSEYEVNAIHKVVDETQKRRQFFDDAALKGQIYANEILNRKHSEDDLNLNEVESFSRLTARNKETVMGKNPDTAIQINQAGEQPTEIRIV